MLDMCILTHVNVHSSVIHMCFYVSFSIYCYCCCLLVIGGNVGDVKHVYSNYSVWVVLLQKLLRANKLYRTIHLGLPFKLLSDSRSVKR